MTAGYRIRELLTAKILPMPEEGYGKGGRRVLKYTKHYYASTSLSTGIGSERIASYLGTRQSVGLYCDQETTLIAPLDAKVLEAGQALEDLFAHFDKTIDLDTPYLYGNSRNFVCDPTQLTEAFGAYWYHPDHLGSSSYITNLAGEINQHMEYLPFGELLVEEHLNSNNSPYKFNAKEFDSETGNYYYGARYYDPKWSIWLSVDPLFEKYPTLSPYIYTAQNPVIYVDPDGAKIVNADRLRLNRAKTYLNRYNNQLGEFSNMSRKELRNKGLLERYKDLKSRIKIARRNVRTYKTRAKKTDMIMAKWKKESPNLYKKIDNMEVDLHLGVDGNRIGAEVFGATAGPLCIDGEYQYLSDIGENALDIFINSGVNISHKDEETGEYSLNHEGGHFIFAIENPIQYEEDKLNIEARGEDYKGGHHPDATTGKTAREYGSKKDINEK